MLKITMNGFPNAFSDYFCHFFDCLRLESQVATSYLRMRFLNCIFKELTLLLQLMKAAISTHPSKENVFRNGNCKRSLKPSCHNLFTHVFTAFQFMYSERLPWFLPISATQATHRNA